ncbi:MAG: hypothetical protein ACNS60_01080 [Candidatus Cyclobacteriaceae bacterium M2_1C_046]
MDQDIISKEVIKTLTKNQGSVYFIDPSGAAEAFEYEHPYPTLSHIPYEYARRQLGSKSDIIAFQVSRSDKKLLLLKKDFNRDGETTFEEIPLPDDYKEIR